MSCPIPPLLHFCVPPRPGFLPSLITGFGGVQQNIATQSKTARGRQKSSPCRASGECAVPMAKEGLAWQMIATSMSVCAHARAREGGEFVETILQEAAS